MNIHHVGYLVKSIRAAVPEFMSLGYRLEGAGNTVYDPLRGTDILFMVNGAVRIELVEPADEDSVVAGMFQKIGSSPYHICYECEDMEHDSRMLREKGFVPVGRAEPAAALGGRNVCFLFKRPVGLVELVEA